MYKHRIKYGLSLEVEMPVLVTLTKRQAADTKSRFKWLSRTILQPSKEYKKHR